MPPLNFKGTFGSFSGGGRVTNKSLPASPGVLTAPTDLSIIPGPDRTPGWDQATLKWTPVPGAVGYHVRVSNVAGGKSSMAWHVKVYGPVAVLSLPDRSVMHYLSVVALGAGIESPRSAEIAFVMPA